MRLILACAVALVCGVSAEAATVELKGLHLCCGGCVSAVEGALEGVDGVSNITVDRGAGAAKFDAKDAKVVAAALQSVADEGFFASVMVDGKESNFPNEAVAKGTKSKSAKFSGVHLCCRSCTQSVVRALQKDPVLATIECDQDAGTVVIASKGGEDIDLAAVQAALNKAGFYGKLEAEKK